MGRVNQGGASFEQAGVNWLQNSQTDVQTQVSIVPNTADGTPANYMVRVDAVGTDADGNIVLTEFKSSATAGFTPNQTTGYPLISEYGGTVVGNNGGQAYPTGTQFPPTTVNVVRPGGF